MLHVLSPTPPHPCPRMSNAPQRKTTGKASCIGFVPRMVSQYYIAPQSRTRHVLDILSCIALLYNIATVPYRASFESDSNEVFLALDLFFDILYGAISLSHFLDAHAPADSHEALQKSRLASFMHYFRWTFWVDFALIVPFDWFLEDPKWRLNRLLGLIRFEMLYSSLENFFRNRFPVALRFGKLFVYLILMIHFGACFWYLSANIDYSSRPSSRYRFSPTHIVPQPFHASTLRTLLQTREPNPSYTIANFRQYIVSLYFSSYYMVGFQSMLPQDLIQAFYAVCIVVIGAGFFATIISTASALVNDANRTQQQFTQKITELKDYMRFRKISPKLRKDIELYYNYLHRAKRLVNRTQILSDIDRSLDRQIAKSLHKDLVEKVPLFKAVDNPLFIDDICTMLHYTLLLKGYYIIRKGEIGKEMYFIKSGTVEVVNEDGDVIYAQLTEGSFFGAVALTSEDSARTASIRAAENCELYYLTKSGFEEILSIYPDALEIIKKITQKRVQETVHKDKEVKEERQRKQEEEAKELEAEQRRIAKELELASESSDDEDAMQALSTATSTITDSSDEDNVLNRSEDAQGVNNEEHIGRVLSSPHLASNITRSSPDGIEEYPLLRQFPRSNSPSTRNSLFQRPLSSAAHDTSSPKSLLERLSNLPARRTITPTHGGSRIQFSPLSPVGSGSRQGFGLEGSSLFVDSPASTRGVGLLDFRPGRRFEVNSESGRRRGEGGSAGAQARRRVRVQQRGTLDEAQEETTRRVPSLYDSLRQTDQE